MVTTETDSEALQKELEATRIELYRLRQTWVEMLGYLTQQIAYQRTLDHKDAVEALQDIAHRVSAVRLV